MLREGFPPQATGVGFPPGELPYGTLREREQGGVLFACLPLPNQSITKTPLPFWRRLFACY
ncbi:hypothetical protein [Nostoc sp. NIES-3756]|uniref:hypothetical protein n=1 Tax=Nostoc sp. NIES-3756 TaxID=1751286 RepID=UPI000AAE0DEE|nr:hypothetical protein [Nostoc sp. NIES-3756]